MLWLVSFAFSKEEEEEDEEEEEEEEHGQSVKTSKLKILQIIMWNIGMAQKAKETRSGCLVHIVQ